MRSHVRAKFGDATLHGGTTLALDNRVGFRQMLRGVRSPRWLQTCFDKLVRDQGASERCNRRGFFGLDKQAVPNRNGSLDLVDRRIRADFAIARFRRGSAVSLRIAFRQDIRSSASPAFRWHIPQTSSYYAG